MSQAAGPVFRSATTGALLAYSGWWATGAILWWVEREDRRVRLHAAQSMIVFGAIALLIVLLAALALASLSFLPSMFGVLAIAALLSWIGGVVLWGVVMWRVARGDDWRMPVAGALAERLARL